MSAFNMHRPYERTSDERQILATAEVQSHEAELQQPNPVIRLAKSPTAKPTLDRNQASIRLNPHRLSRRPVGLSQIDVI
jgi:hypothetical protein